MPLTQIDRYEPTVDAEGTVHLTRTAGGQIGGDDDAEFVDRGEFGGDPVFAADLQAFDDDGDTPGGTPVGSGAAIEPAIDPAGNVVFVRTVHRHESFWVVVYRVRRADGSFSTITWGVFRIIARQGLAGFQWIFEADRQWSEDQLRNGAPGVVDVSFFGFGPSGLRSPLIAGVGDQVFISGARALTEILSDDPEWDIGLYRIDAGAGAPVPVWEDQFVRDLFGGVPDINLDAQAPVQMVAQRDPGQPAVIHQITHNTLDFGGDSRTGRRRDAVEIESWLDADDEPTHPLVDRSVGSLAWIDLAGGGGESKVFWRNKGDADGLYRLVREGAVAAPGRPGDGRYEWVIPLWQGRGPNPQTVGTRLPYGVIALVDATPADDRWAAVPGPPLPVWFHVDDDLPDGDRTYLESGEPTAVARLAVAVGSWFESPHAIRAFPGAAAVRVTIAARALDADRALEVRIVRPDVTGAWASLELTQSTLYTQADLTDPSWAGGTAADWQKAVVELRPAGGGSDRIRVTKIRLAVDWNAGWMLAAGPSTWHVPDDPAEEFAAGPDLAEWALIDPDISLDRTGPMVHFEDGARTSIYVAGLDLGTGHHVVQEFIYDVGVHRYVRVDGAQTTRFTADELDAALGPSPLGAGWTRQTLRLGGNDAFADAAASIR